MTLKKIPLYMQLQIRVYGSTTYVHASIEAIACTPVISWSITLLSDSQEIQSSNFFQTFALQDKYRIHHSQVHLKSRCQYLPRINAFAIDIVSVNY